MAMFFSFTLRQIGIYAQNETEVVFVLIIIYIYILKRGESDLFINLITHIDLFE